MLDNYNDFAIVVNNKYTKYASINNILLVLRKTHILFVILFLVQLFLFFFISVVVVVVYKFCFRIWYDIK